MLAAIQLTDGFSAVKADSLIYSMVFFPMFFILFAHFFHVYHTLWRFAVWQDFMRIAAADITAIALCIIVHRVFGLMFSIGYYCMFAVLSAFLLCSIRVLYRQYLNHSYSSSHNDDMLRGNIMLIGAGSTSNIVIEDINVNHNSKSCKVRCVIDDDPLKKGHYVSGVLIVGGRDEIISAAKKYDIDMIVFAIPACPKEQRSAILRICQKTHCELRIIPSVVQLLTDSKEVVKSVKKVEIEDLLGREPIKMDIDVVMNYVSGKTVLVTGGGGSIGSELCRQIASHSPKLLIIFVLDMGEPVRILDLAENLIRLSGYEPYVDINIKFTGLRPGEKLYEEMLMSEEGLQQTDNHLIFIGHPIDFDENEFKKVLFEMKEKMYDENADIRAYVKKLVPTYNYTPASGSHTDNGRNKITV